MGGLHYSAPPALVAASAVVCTSTVAWRRRSPTAASFVALTAVLAYQRLSHDSLGIIEPVAVVLALYSFARGEVQSGRRARLAVLGLYALGVSAAIDAGSSGFSAVEVLLSWAPMTVLPAAAAVLVERHRDLIARLAETAARLEEEQAARADQATTRERNRVARELHDVVAHSLSVMVIQAGAARLLAPNEPQGANDALDVVVSCGREALGDLRRVMGVLRRDDPLSEEDRPGLAHLDRIIKPVRAAGLDTSLCIEGEPFKVPAEVDLAAYRVVQEALTNAAKHAGPAQATVGVRYQPGAVEVEITDTGTGGSALTSRVTGSGQGLIGMSERVALCGGRLEVGPTAGRGYRVHARLPLTFERPFDDTGPQQQSQARHPSLLQSCADPLFAAASLVALEAAALSYGHHHGWLALNVSVVAGISVAGLWRRRTPLLFLALVGALAFAAHGLTPTDRSTMVGTYLVLVPTYNLGVWSSRERATAGLLIWLVGAVGASMLHRTLSAGLIGASLMALLAWGAGRLVRRQRDLADQLRVTTSRLAAEREQRTRAAVVEERTRLARGLQNHVAQLIVAMVVQAEAAARLLLDKPVEAVNATASIEATGREALGQVRHILGVLRSSSSGRELRPLPGLDQLQTLIQHAHDQGQSVELTIDGEQTPLLGGVDLVAYRIIEEALQLAPRPARQPLSVSLRYTDDVVELEVGGAALDGTDWPSPTLRARVALVHGDLCCPNGDSRGRRLAVRLPRPPQGALI